VRMQIKSPLQWLVQTSKVLETPLPGGFFEVGALRQLGQIPFAPPNVKGWDGGKTWITTSTLLTRYNLSNFMLGNGAMALDRQKKLVVTKAPDRPEPMVMNQVSVDFQKIAPSALRADPDKLVANLTMRLFQTPLPARDTQTSRDFLTDKNNDTSDQTVRELLHLMMSTPQYQLT